MSNEIKKNAAELNDNDVKKVTGGAESDYQNMFENCPKPETAPLLPAQELGQNCYNYMFEPEQDRNPGINEPYPIFD